MSLCKQCIIYLFGCSGSLLLCKVFSSCGKLGLRLVAEHELLTAVSSLVAEHGLQSLDSVVVAHGLSCSAACRIFLGQGSNLCPLNWQADSYLLYHRGSPRQQIFISLNKYLRMDCVLYLCLTYEKRQKSIPKCLFHFILIRNRYRFQLAHILISVSYCQAFKF